jgi:hypothetical protein
MKLARPKAHGNWARNQGKHALFFRADPIAPSFAFTMLAFDVPAVLLYRY